MRAKWAREEAREAAYVDTAQHVLALTQVDPATQPLGILVVIVASLLATVAVLEPDSPEATAAASWVTHAQRVLNERERAFMKNRPLKSVL